MVNCQLSIVNCQLSRASQQIISDAALQTFFCDAVILFQVDERLRLHGICRFDAALRPMTGDDVLFGRQLLKKTNGFFAI